MTELERLCYELAFNQYFSEWNGDVEDTLYKLSGWYLHHNSGHELDDSIVVWQPFEEYEPEELLDLIEDSLYIYKEFAKKLSFITL